MPQITLNHAVAESSAKTATEITAITLTDTGWAFTLRGTRYTMPEPYPETVLPDDPQAARFCFRAIVQGTATPR